MIIDDDVEVAGALHEYFTNIHYSVEVRLNGEDALRQFQRDTPEVVLLDLAIPATDSVQVLQRMRAAHPKVLVIIVTANDTDIALARQTLTMGAFDYVTKPIDFDHLERVVRVALAHHDRLMTGPAGRRMELPTRLTVHNSWYALDGGTIVLQAINEAGQEHRVTLVQHALPQPSPWLREIPGRLYFDGDLIPIRSDLEARVLALLRTAEVTTSGPVTAHGESIQLSPNAVLGADIRQVLTRGPEENIRALLADVIRFVESDEYLRFAERVEQAADSTRYTVWVACDPSSRNQVAVRLGRVLGIGLRAVLELLDRGAPVAKDVTAVEVSELTEQCGVEGLRLRIDPPYRWRLASRL